MSNESHNKGQFETRSATGTELDEASDTDVVVGVALLRNILKDFATVKVMTYDPSTDDLELVIENSEVSGEEDTLQIGHGTLDTVLKVCVSVSHNYVLPFGGLFRRRYFSLELSSFRIRQLECVARGIVIQVTLQF